MGVPILLVFELLASRDARSAEAAGNELREGEVLIFVFVDLAPDELFLSGIIQLFRDDRGMLPGVPVAAADSSGRARIRLPNS
jgi:hypothetical protein